MAVMSIRKVPMGMRHHDMDVPMNMRFADVCPLGVGMLVMHVMNMFVHVLVGGVGVQVPAKLRQVRPHADGHQGTSH